MVDITKPIMLSREKTQQLKSLDAHVDFVRKEIQRAKLAGLDIGTMEKDFEATEKKRKALILEYGTN